MKLIFVALLALSANSQTICAGIPIMPPLACTATADGTQYLTVGPLTAIIKTSKTVRGEVPARSSDGKGWTLKGQPISGVTCWRNRLHQIAGVDYVLAVAAPYITSNVWDTGDMLACDYETAK